MKTQKIKTEQLSDKIISILSCGAGGAVVCSGGGIMLSYIGAVIGLGFGIYDNFRERH